MKNIGNLKNIVTDSQFQDIHCTKCGAWGSGYYNVGDTEVWEIWEAGDRSFHLATGEIDDVIEALSQSLDLHGTYIETDEGCYSVGYPEAGELACDTYYVKKHEC